MIRDWQSCKVTLNRELARHAKRICRLWDYSNVQGNRVTPVGNGLVLTRTVCMVSLNLGQSGGTLYVGTGRESQSAELVHNSAHDVRLVINMMATVGRGIRLGTIAQLSAQVGRIRSLALVSGIGHSGGRAIMRHLTPLG
jgi:PPE-repeat protein